MSPTLGALLDVYYLGLNQETSYASSTETSDIVSTSSSLTSSETHLRTTSFLPVGVTSPRSTSVARDAEIISSSSAVSDDSVSTSSTDDGSSTSTEATTANIVDITYSTKICAVLVCSDVSSTVEIP